MTELDALKEAAAAAIEAAITDLLGAGAGLSVALRYGGRADVYAIGDLIDMATVGVHVEFPDNLQIETG